MCEGICELRLAPHERSPVGKSDIVRFKTLHFYLFVKNLDIIHIYNSMSVCKGWNLTRERIKLRGHENSELAAKASNQVDLLRQQSEGHEIELIQAICTEVESCSD